MFSFLKRDPVKALEKEYKKLMEESYQLSTSDRSASDEKRMEAEAIAAKIDALRANN